jgi:anti-sigma factor RsiW
MANHLPYDVLTRYVEERQAPEEQARTERHLARCARCRDEMRWLERIRNYPLDRTRLKDSA